MPNEPSDSFKDGVEGGLGGKTSDDNPQSRGVADSIFNALGTIAVGGLSDLNAEQDRAASEWEAGRQEGERLSKDK